MLWQRSITLRLTLLFALASTTVLVAVGTIVGFVMEKHFEHMDFVEEIGKMELVQHALSKVATSKELNALPQQLDDALIGHPGLSVTVLDARMKTIYATAGANFPATLLDNSRAYNSNKLTPVVWQQNGHDYSGIASTVSSGLRGAQKFTVAIALDIQHRKQFMQVFEDTLWVIFGFGIALSALLGWVAAHQGLSPVRHIALVAKGISASQLNDRLPLDSVPSELHDLAESFNGMLSRLEASFQRLTHFSSDLAHELRAPVSNLMTQSQVALSKARSNDEYRDVLASNLEEFDRLARMISDMLFLAKADNGLMTTQHDAIDLVAEIQQLIEFYEPLSEESGITISVQGSGSTIGDQLMIRRALSNLLSNALRHTQRGGEIIAAVQATSSGEVQVSIENPGPAIAAQHIAHLFDRFYRVDPARLHNSEGAGLGLAITKSIIEAHRGRISVTSNDTRTRFEIILPGTEPG
jgi:two-component system heavy metal sensor histidine kinase CusS